MRTIISFLPDWAKKILRQLKHIARVAPYYGKGRFCPICEKSSRKFLQSGRVIRNDALCIHCDSLERHRFIWLYLMQKTNLFNGKPKQILHVAPETCLEPRFKKLFGKDYLTADLISPHAMVKMDITEIKYPDQSFDVIYCGHVLEHVQDDIKAMKEFFRVLKNDGWAILTVPIGREKTFEDNTIVKYKDRLKAFGHEDHVRRYGSDYVDRLCEAGFKVEVIKLNDLVNNNEAVRMGLTNKSTGDIYYCTK